MLRANLVPRVHLIMAGMAVPQLPKVTTSGRPLMPRFVMVWIRKKSRLHQNYQRAQMLATR
jgi:hypothetical protein